MPPGGTRIVVDQEGQEDRGRRAEAAEDGFLGRGNADAQAFAPEDPLRRFFDLLDSEVTGPLPQVPRPSSMGGYPTRFVEPEHTLEDYCVINGELKAGFEADHPPKGREGTSQRGRTSLPPPVPLDIEVRWYHEPRPPAARVSRVA